MSQDTKILKNPFVFSWLVVAGIVVYWIAQMNNSLWMDEFGSYWVIKDGLGAVAERSLNRFHQSPLYYLILWFNSRLFGFSEFALRLPSLAAILGMFWFVYKSAEELFDAETAAYAVAVCATLSDITISVLSVRPYALGLLFCSASIFYLVRWTRRGGIAWGAAYFLATALFLHCQWTFAPFILIHFLLFAFDENRGPAVSWGKFIALLCAAGALMLPLIVELGALWGDRAQLAYYFPQNFKTFNTMVNRLVPYSPLAFLFAGQAFLSYQAWIKNTDPVDHWIYILCSTAAIYCHPAFLIILPIQGLVFAKSPPAPLDLCLIVLLAFPMIFPFIYFPAPLKSVGPALLGFNFTSEYIHSLEKAKLIGLPLALISGVLLGKKIKAVSIKNLAAIHLFWIFFPALLTLSLAIWGGANVFAPRYFVYWTLGFSSLLAILIRRLSHPALKSVFVVLLLVFWALGQKIDVSWESRQDWKAASQTVNQWVSNDQTDVLFLSGYIEARQLRWLTDPSHVEILSMPVIYYPIRGKVTVLPFYLEDAPTRPYLEEVVAKTALKKKDFIFYRGWGDPGMRAWMEERFKKEGFEVAQTWNRGILDILSFKFVGKH